MTPPRQHMDNPKAKRILVLCDEGVNRSATLSHLLQYWGHDCIAKGLNRTRPATLRYLADWADLIIITDIAQRPTFDELIALDESTAEPDEYDDTIQVWQIGPDEYPRPFNKELYTKIRDLIAEHADELKPTPTTTT